VKRASLVVLRLVAVALAFLAIFRPELLGLKSSLFGDVDVVEVLTKMREVSQSGLGWFVFCMFCATSVKLAGIFSGIIRWKILLRGQGLQMPFWYMTYQWFMGRFIGLLLPGTLGLDGYRLVESSLYTKEVEKCTAVIAVEKLTGIIALALLVFLTFPLGFKFFPINKALLFIIMGVLFCGVTVSLLLLLNPRVIQVLCAVLPVPAKLRNMVNRLGVAVTAYSGSRASLLLALFFALCVHLGMCFMYFFTFLGLRAENVSISDIFFVSPLVITASVLAFTISGLGVREGIFSLILGSTAGGATTVLGGHLGLWSGEIVPFVLSIPLLIFGKRPDRAQLEADIAKVRAMGGGGDMVMHLKPEEVQAYRGKVYSCVAVGIISGLVAGAFVGLGECAWLWKSLGGLPETGLFTWGPLAYGLMFIPAGLGVAGALLFIYLLADRFAPWKFTGALSFSGALLVGTLVIGAFRLKRDVLAGHVGGLGDYLPVLILALGAGLCGFALFYAKTLTWARLFKEKPSVMIGLGLSAYVIMVLVGAVAGAVLAPSVEEQTFTPAAQSQGPNIILIGIDTLRADALRIYNPDAPANLPALEAFAGDSVVFEKSSAQASWTKPAFATLFTGLYPSTHTAVSKVSVLPESVDTLAERLRLGGYYTQGFANNPNILRLFGFAQGFEGYTELKPTLYFGATPSSAKLSLYEVLRKGRQKILGKIPLLGKRLGRMVVTDFYQPAERVTQEGLDWLDKAPQGDAPFFLFLHYMDPHDPFMDPEAPGGGYARARMEHPDADLATAMRAAYDGEITHLDTYLGTLFEGLKARGLYDDTVILLVGDHGEEFMEHGGWWHGYTLYEEMTHVPLVLKLPGNDQGGMRNTDLARQVDVAPTLLHLADVPIPEVMPGLPLYDVSGIFTNATIGYAYAENDFEGNALRAVRTKDEKLIEALSLNERYTELTDPLELYDLNTDPGEQNNRVDEAAYVDQKSTLQQTMVDYQKVCSENAAEPQGITEIDSDISEQLDALGYIE
jgi:arylsulfatase A-like enzyme